MLAVIGDGTPLRQTFVICPTTRDVLPNTIMQVTSPWILTSPTGRGAPVVYPISNCPFAARVVGSVCNAVKEYFSDVIGVPAHPEGNPT